MEEQTAQTLARELGVTEAWQEEHLELLRSEEKTRDLEESFGYPGLAGCYHDYVVHCCVKDPTHPDCAQVFAFPQSQKIKAWHFAW